MKLLHIDSSILGDASASRTISAAATARLKALDPTLEVTYRDLVADPLPHVTLPGLASEEAKAVLDQFLAADVVVIGAPMYNFGLATQLKAWFDHILIAGQTFRYGPDGAEGLAAGKQVIIAHARGGLYAEGTPTAADDHALGHLRTLFRLIGVADPRFIVAEGLAFGAEAREAALREALARAGALPPAPMAAAA